MKISLQRESSLDVAEFRHVLSASGLGAIRPVHDGTRLRRMLDGAGLLVTARGETGELLGVGRCLSDGAWVAYLADLAVARSAQSLGIGRRLLARIHEELGPEVMLVLASVPDAVDFYARMRMTPVNDVFCYPRQA